jgi:hypothetical protein
MEFNKKELAKLRKQFLDFRQEVIEIRNEDGDKDWEKKNLVSLEKSFKNYVACIKDYVERRVIEFSDEFAEHFREYYEEDVFLK